MRREPSLSLSGALSILGYHEPRLIGQLDKLLGGIILGAGASAGLVALGMPPLAPLAAFAAAWGWVEQKNQAIELLRVAMRGLTRKVINTTGYERRQLISAAHTTIAVSAFFESFHDEVKKIRPHRERLHLSDEEKMSVANGRALSGAHTFIDVLYKSEVPAPSPVRGYEENIVYVRRWMEDVARQLAKYLQGFKVGRDLQLNWQEVITHGVERYQSHYLELAAAVPEFMVWTLLGEHAATRSAIDNLRPDLRDALDVSRAALGRVEAILGLISSRSDSRPDLCSVVERANRAVLNQPIIQTELQGYSPDVVFPTVSLIYINPHYRIVPATVGIRPGDEAFWNMRPARDNLDVALTAYITAPDATAFPLLLLGHPGAGKSLLTQVFAAQLPASGYTVVRVPLRQVGANSPIIDQIQQGLDLVTNRRVEWPRLVEQSRHTVRVVLLDGLDELLQATNSDRSGYLQEVMEFQRVEAQQERPVAVLVTSRTVVADRVDIPNGTTVIKLDHFSESQIKDWLLRWRESNEWRITAGNVRAFTWETARKQIDLVRQPLLLMMLALYISDPTFPALDENVSTAQLYVQLLDSFATREVMKRAVDKLKVDEIESRVQDQLDRLSVAALGMFNRGRQNVSETEIGDDLRSLRLTPQGTYTSAELGQRLVGEFFFVHTAQAKPRALTSETPSTADMISEDGATRRCYEFLHSTFAEYFVANRVLNELLDVAESVVQTGRRRRREPDDDLMFALLSHYPLAVRRSTLDFAKDLFSALSYDERRHALDTLEYLIGSYRQRRSSDRYSNYQPIPVDHLRELAAYSANLIALRVALEPDNEEVLLDTLLRTSSDVWRDWQSTVILWRAGLDSDGLGAMLATLKLAGTSVQLVGRDSQVESAHADALFARLLGADWPARTEASESRAGTGASHAQRSPQRR